MLRRTIEGYDCFIRHFCDGDTVLVIYQCSHCGKWEERYIRIRGIDSYELKSPNSEMAKMVAYKWTRLYGGKSATLLPTQKYPEKHGRIVADIMIDGNLLSKLLVDSGDAWYSNQRA